MDSDIVLFIVQDGVIAGAIYALLAIGILVVFAVSRVIFVPQGEFVTFGALTLAALADGRLPGTAWLVLGLGGAAFLADVARDRRTWDRRLLARRFGLDVLLPIALTGLATWLAPLKPTLAVRVLLTLALVVPIGPFLYRLAYRPLADQSVLVLFIASIGVHLALTGLGLLAFGPEGYKIDALWEASFPVGVLSITGQNILVVGVALVAMLALWAFFEASLTGKALRAVAVNRVGARLVGIPTERAGQLAFALAAVIGTLAGILIISTTTVFYDTGFLIGLKGFVAAIIGGMSATPPAVLAAMLVGLVESFSAFWASAFKEVIVFALIVPVLLWRSLAAPAGDEED